MGQKMPREKKEVQQGEYEMALLDELVPKDHLLRKIAAAVDFISNHDVCKASVQSLSPRLERKPCNTSVTRLSSQKHTDF